MPQTFKNFRYTAKREQATFMHDQQLPILPINAKQADEQGVVVKKNGPNNQHPTANRE
jgi:hypothetical protein